MIERIVLVKLTEPHTASSARETIAEHTQQTLTALPGVISASVGVPADERSAASWDLSVVLRFASLADVASYVSDPKHREFVDQYLRPKLEVIKAWNFELA